MDTISFPGWAGPVIGAVVGVGIGVVHGLNEGPGVSVPWVALWASAGAAAGCVVWLVDASRRSQARHEDCTPRLRPSIESPAVRGGLWCWLTLLLVVGPFIGYLGVEKFLGAWRMSHWPTAQATILESHVKASTHTNLSITTESFTPVVRYRYVVDGVEREGRAIDQSPLDVSHGERDKAEAVVARYPAWSTHEVHHDPEDPARAVLEPGVPWGEAVLFLVVPLAALVMAVLAFLSLRAEQEAKSA